MSGRASSRVALWRPISRGVGLLAHVPALMAVLTMPLCVFFGEYHGLAALGITAGVGVVFGQLLFWPARGQTPTQPRHAMLIAAISWLAVSVIGALPFVLGADTTVVNAAFESLSGFTGTGLSVLTPSNLPHYLQWWRSFSEWIGGVGVIVLLLSILPPRRGALELYYSESRDQKLLPSVRSTARAIWSIYLSYTLLGIGLLWLGHVPLWTAINNGMTAIATGGFSISDQSLMHTPALAKALYIPIMIAGAISFYAHYQSIRLLQPRRALFNNSEQRLFWSVLVLGALALAADNTMLYQADWLDSILQWVSALTTTGFQSADLSQWHPGSLFLMALAMLAGATAGSTAGGLKMVRLVVLYKSVIWRLAEISRRPHEVIRLTFDGEALTRAEADARVSAVITVTLGWLATTIIAIVVMTHCVPIDTPLQITVFDVISAQSNVGLSAGLVNASLSTPGKLTLMTVMWMGRLEIVPVMVLVAVTLRRGVYRRA